MSQTIFHADSIKLHIKIKYLARLNSQKLLFDCCYFRCTTEKYCNESYTNIYLSVMCKTKL